MRSSIIKSGELRDVFRSFQANDFNAHLAQLCVFYEDLRIELHGMTALTMARLDVLDSVKEHGRRRTMLGRYRKHYFLRRSFATVREFAEYLAKLRECPEFLAFRSHADEKSATILDSAIRFFSTNEQLLRTVRNNTGGHFTLDAAQYAVKHLSPSVMGKLVYDLENGNENVKLHFAGELVATAFLKGIPGRTIEDKVDTAVKRVMEAFQPATSVIWLMIDLVLRDRFGK